MIMCYTSEVIWQFKKVGINKVDLIKVDNGICKDVHRVS